MKDSQQLEGLIPTKNRTGYMTEKLDEYTSAFVHYARRCKLPVLDMGCAYGVVTLAALAQNAKVVAADLSQDHLNELMKKVSHQHKKNITCIETNVLDDGFEENSFDAILCARVLHFLTGDEIHLAMKNLVKWLAPGGKLFITTETPYVKLWRECIKVFENRKQQGEQWPGAINHFDEILPSPTASKFINFITPDILQRICEQAGLTIEKVGYIDRKDTFPQEALLDGRESAGIIAVKKI